MEIKERSDDSSFSLFLVNNNETLSDAKCDFRGQPQLTSCVGAIGSNTIFCEIALVIEPQAPVSATPEDNVKLFPVTRIFGSPCLIQPFFLSGQTFDRSC